MNRVRILKLSEVEGFVTTASHFVPLTTYRTPKPLPVKRKLGIFGFRLPSWATPQFVGPFWSKQHNKYGFTKMVPARRELAATANFN